VAVGVAVLEAVAVGVTVAVAVAAVVGVAVTEADVVGVAVLEAATVGGAVPPVPWWPRPAALAGTTYAAGEAQLAFAASVTLFVPEWSAMATTAPRTDASLACNPPPSHREYSVFLLAPEWKR
jgi:hypothetical protein